MGIKYIKEQLKCFIGYDKIFGIKIKIKYFTKYVRTYTIFMS